MADLVIRGMEMPNKDEILVFDVWHGKVYARSTANTGTRRYEVVSLPEWHGRLIDADAVVKTICNSCDGQCEVVQCDCLNCKADCRCDIVKEISDAPTIIEADLEWKMKNCCCFSNTDQAEGCGEDG